MRVESPKATGQNTAGSGTRTGPTQMAIQGGHKSMAHPTYQLSLPELLVQMPPHQLPQLSEPCSSGLQQMACHRPRNAAGLRALSPDKDPMPGKALFPAPRTRFCTQKLTIR